MAWLRDVVEFAVAWDLLSFVSQWKVMRDMKTLFKVDLILILSFLICAGEGEQLVGQLVL